MSFSAIWCIPGKNCTLHHTATELIHRNSERQHNCSGKLTRSTERGAASENCIVCSLPGSTAVPAECPHWPKGTAAVEQSRREETIPLVEQAPSPSAVTNQRPTVSCSQVSHHLFCLPSSLLTRCCVLLPPSIYESFLASERKKWMPCETKPVHKQTNMIECFSQSIIVSITINNDRFHNSYQNNFGKL